MRFWGILRVSCLFILVPAFYGQPVSCSNLKVNPSTEVPNVEVPEISEKPKDSTVEPQVAEDAKISGPAPGSAPKSNLVFENATWDVSQLASSNLFIRQFCKDVREAKFDAHIPTEKIKKLDEACLWVNSYLKSFSWRRVRGLRENPYEDALKPDKFKDYAKWIVENIPEIKKSMHNMYDEALKLSEKQLETATSSGPYKYGFVCNDNWWKILLSGWLGGHNGCNPITFLYTIDKLHKRLGDILGSSPENSTVKSQAV
ncbi:secreted antigen 1 [Babesia divergens]|uniref:Secreted antigen 1 n=1 Tax=Babesia divergens TaxID=32595 RepID=A0AAD9LF60_BABDI|nr:secreted antigen 1 [Babesia divergens]